MTNEKYTLTLALNKFSNKRNEKFANLNHEASCSKSLWDMKKLQHTWMKTKCHAYEMCHQTTKLQEQCHKIKLAAKIENWLK